MQAVFKSAWCWLAHLRHRSGWIQQDGILVPVKNAGPLGASKIKHCGFYMAKHIFF